MAVSYKMMDWRGPARPSFFWFDTDSGNYGPFCVTQVISTSSVEVEVHNIQTGLEFRPNLETWASRTEVRSSPSHRDGACRMSRGIRRVGARPVDHVQPRALRWNLKAKPTPRLKPSVSGKVGFLRTLISQQWTPVSSTAAHLQDLLFGNVLGYVLNLYYCIQSIFKLSDMSQIDQHNQAIYRQNAHECTSFSLKHFRAIKTSYMCCMLCKHRWQSWPEMPGLCNLNDSRGENQVKFMGLFMSPVAFLELLQPATV